MAFTTEQLTKLENAIASGRLTVRFRDRTVTYRSLAEMLQIRDAMAAELNGSARFGSRQRYPSTSKGHE